MDSNSFNNPVGITAPKPAKAAKAKARAPVLPDGTSFFVASIPTPKPAQVAPRRSSPGTPQQRSERAPAKKAAPARSQFDKVNPRTAVSGVPKVTGYSERQLDGNRSPITSKPVKKGGLAERGPSAGKSGNDRTSGLESAMHAEADRLHPRRATKISQKSKFML